MSNLKEQLISGIKEAAKRRDDNLKYIRDQKEQARLNYMKRIKELAPRIKDLLDVDQVMCENKMSLGELRNDVLKRTDFVSEGIYHKTGFIVERGMGNYNSPAYGVGIINGGCDGPIDLVINRNGDVVKGDKLNLVMKRFLKEFDEFEKKYYNFVKSLIQ